MFGINLNLPSAELYFLIGYGYIKSIAEWVLYNNNIILILQFVAIMFSIKVITKIVSANKKECVKKIQSSSILVVSHNIVLQILYFIVAIILTTNPEGNVLLLYKTIKIIYVVGILGNYIIPRFLHDLYSLNKRRNYLFILLTLGMLIWFLAQSPIGYDNARLYAYSSLTCVIIFSIIALSYSGYMLFTAIKNRKKGSKFTEKLSAFIIFLFSIDIIHNIINLIEYEDAPFYISMENVSIMLVLSLVLFVTINGVFYYGYSRLYNRR